MNKYKQQHLYCFYGGNLYVNKKKNGYNTMPGNAKPGAGGVVHVKIIITNSNFELHVYLYDYITVLLKS